MPQDSCWARPSHRDCPSSECRPRWMQCRCTYRAPAKYNSSFLHQNNHAPISSFNFQRKIREKENRFFGSFLKKFKSQENRPSLHRPFRRWCRCACPPRIRRPTNTPSDRNEGSDRAGLIARIGPQILPSDSTFDSGNTYVQMNVSELDANVGTDLNALDFDDLEQCQIRDRWVLQTQVSSSLILVRQVVIQRKKTSSLGRKISKKNFSMLSNI